MFRDREWTQLGRVAWWAPVRAVYSCISLMLRLAAAAALVAIALAEPLPDDYCDPSTENCRCGGSCTEKCSAGEVSRCSSHPLPEPRPAVDTTFSPNSAETDRCHCEGCVNPFWQSENPGHSAAQPKPVPRPKLSLHLISVRLEFDLNFPVNVWVCSPFPRQSASSCALTTRTESDLSLAEHTTKQDI